MVDWVLAQRVASGALLLKPSPATYRSSALQGQFDDLTARAETLVSEATGLHSRHGSARAKVTDRPGWAAANVRSIERLVGPALARAPTGPGRQAGRALARGGSRRGRHPARPDARLHGDAGARPVRPPHQRRDARGPGSGLLRRAQHRGGRAAVRLRPQPVPPLAGLARGDPPHAVHGGALAARPLRRPDHRAARPPLGRPGQLRRDGQADGHRGAGGAQPGRRVRRHGHAGHARAAARPSRRSRG